VIHGARRALDLRGELDAVDDRGHRVRLVCDGERIVVRFDGAGAALAAARSARALRADGLRRLLASLVRHSPVPPQAFAIDLWLGDRVIGRAGRGAAPNWLGRLVGAPGVELRLFALLAAVARAR
jgi:hypothetical protein